MAVVITEHWIRDKVGLKHDKLDDVKALSLPGTYQEKITEIGYALKSFTRLRHLDLSRNSISTLEGLDHLLSLETLNLYYNNISSLKELYKLRHLKNLKDIDLRLNPVAKNEPDYRLFLVHMLPNLRKLDDRSVRDSERRAALLHFTTDQAAEMNGRSVSPSKRTEEERFNAPRREHVKSLGSRPTALDDDDVAIIDMISKTGGDLSQAGSFTGSRARIPDFEDYSRDELRGMQARASPTEINDIHNPPTRQQAQGHPHRNSDRVYVQFNDDHRLSDNRDKNLQYTDEIEAYTTYKARGNFTPNPSINQATNEVHENRSHGVAAPHRARDHRVGRGYDGRAEKREPSPLRLTNGHTSDSRSYEISLEKRRSSPNRIPNGTNSRGQENGSLSASGYEQGPSQSDEVNSKQEEMLFKLLDVVDKYWNGSKSLHKNSRFLGQANKIIWAHLSQLGTSKESLTSDATSSQYRNERVQAELNERAAEMTRLQSQLVDIKQNYEKALTKLRDQAEVHGSLELANQELESSRVRIRELQEENRHLRAKLIELETTTAVSQGQQRELVDLQKRTSDLQEELHSAKSQIEQQKQNLGQLNELTAMLQESHRSLVSTNEHLLREMEDTRLRHQHEVQQMHWSYDQLKRTMDWIPSVNN